jgi:hypothetical protein
MRFAFVLPAACAAIALALAARAETRPQVEIKTKVTTFTVTVEPELRKYPGLFEDSLAEGKRRVERNRAEAAKEIRSRPGWFTEGRGWAFETSYVLRSAVGRYVSVVRSDYSYSGGAHPNTYIDTILWDGDARKRTNIRPFFRETANKGPTLQALARLARLAIAAEKIRRESEEDGQAPKVTPEQYLANADTINSGIQPALRGIGPISLAPSTEAGKSSGLTFHYQPYAVGAYAEGSFVATVPWTAFQTYLSAEGAAIFAGQQPESDDFR